MTSVDFNVHVFALGPNTPISLAALTLASPILTVLYYYVETTVPSRSLWSGSADLPDVQLVWVP